MTAINIPTLDPLEGHRVPRLEAEEIVMLRSIALSMKFYLAHPVETDPMAEIYYEAERVLVQGRSRSVAHWMSGEQIIRHCREVLDVRMGKIKPESIHRPAPIFIVGRSYGDSRVIAQENGLASYAWQHVTSEQDFRGVSHRVVWLAPGWRERGDVYELTQMLSDRVKEQGFRVFYSPGNATFL